MIQVVREVKETPEWVAGAVARAGGWNVYGEPRYRVVWGRSRLGWMGGRWNDFDSSGNFVRSCIELRRAPLYGDDRWHLEKYQGPAEYDGVATSPEAWHRKYTEYFDGLPVSTMGPFPSRGDYVESYTFERPDGSFLPLSAEKIAEICRAIERGMEFSYKEKKAAIMRKIENSELMQTKKDEETLELTDNLEEV